ncbi:hypothetical protein BJ322DRAFT_132244 [Thelephora terrestris]|uniref:Protein kinase domain-containing protein n=1 Tax=Thelephora terrestris TaxID=56493 RepID=A0A9P6HRL5_9AGAM|nr:hypothetical protein BJ322DRAFT_132244 [Thelephora terrestris]
MQTFWKTPMETLNVCKVSVPFIPPHLTPPRMFSYRAERIKNASGLGGTTSPSDSIKDFNKIKRTVTFPSGPRYGRPSHRFGPPTVLFNDALARLKYDLEHLDKFTPPHQKLCHAFSLTTIAADFHSSDEERFKSLKDPLKELLGTEASWKESVASGSTIPDGLWLEGPFAYMIFELKNEPGLGGDPFLQSLVVYGNAVKQIVNHLSRSNFPVVLLSMAGNNLVVSTAIYTDAVYADKLLSIDLHLGSHGADNVLRVARVFAAIEECTVRLRAQYRLLDNLQNVQPGVMYPSPTADPPEAEIPRLEFICKLDRQSGARLATVDEANERHAIYLARMQTNTAGDASDNLVFVKFTPKYNQEAHRLLANQDPPLAPALFSCNRIIGDMYMVVMEYMSDASPLHLFFSPFTPPCPLKVEVVRKSLEKALGLLHGQDLVFGDLRQLNILYSHKGDCVFLVDFDWVGKHREDRYSPCLNPVVRSDVGRWEVMKKEHDIRSLEGVMEGLGEKVSV